MLALLRFAARADWRPSRAILGAVALVATCGCTLCPPGYIDDYPTIGGKWQRTDPTEGRVGSPFSDGGVQMSDSYVASDVGDGEVIYDGGIIIDGTGVDSYEGELGSEPYYEDSIELVPQYETLGEDW